MKKYNRFFTFLITTSLQVRYERSNLPILKMGLPRLSATLDTLSDVLVGSLAEGPTFGRRIPMQETLLGLYFNLLCHFQNLAQIFSTRSNVNQANFRTIMCGVILVLSTLMACEPDDTSPEPRGKYESGVIIINEGNFSDADGSLSFYDKDSSKVSNEIFLGENGRQLFALVQNLRFFDDRAFIVTNSDDKIEVVDAENFESIETIKDDIENPNDIAVVDGLAYVSNWGTLTPEFTYLDSRVTIVDLSTSEVIKDIATDQFPSEVLAIDEEVYVAVGNSDEVLVIDAESNDVEDTITVALGPKSFEIDQNGKLWVMCTGTFAEPEGNLVRINPANHTVETTILLEGQSPTLEGKMMMNGAGDQLYYLSSVGHNPSTDAVFVMDIAATTAPADPLIEGTNMYGIGVDPETSTIYIGDSNAFQGNGTVIRYNPDGSQIDSFGVGRGPSGFVFR